MFKKTVLLALITLIFIHHLHAKDRVVNLVVAYKTVYFAGKAAKAIAVNDQIPAPTLHFKQGDHVTINVYNHLDKGTAIHWHGLMLPWQMDGVEGVTQKPIPPGGVFNYQFTLEQSGTYWYHAHAGLQEQQGLYGPFLIDPPQNPPYTYTKDYVITLSDWSNTAPEQILKNLKKNGDYYSPRFPVQPSLMHFLDDYRKSSTVMRKELLGDYKSMQKMRMGIYDFSDVAYDAFLLNGHSNSNPWTAQVKKGDVVRLRFINSAAGTIFHVKIPGVTMKMVHVQGNDVTPYYVNDFTIAPAETFDVLVPIEKAGSYPIYAESRDKVGKAYGALVTQENQAVPYQNIKPFASPIPVTRTMMYMMMGSKTPMHHSMDMPTEPSRAGDKIESPNTGDTTSLDTKYQALKAAVPTNNPRVPVAKVIRMELFGYMDSYIWFINGVPEYNAPPIPFEPGKRYRLVFTNTSMMHHPMHIHGHWFILRKGQGAYDPLLHTIDVPPGATIVADIDTDASGQWFFHCHMLYHMISGMSRVFQYTTLIELTQDKIQPEHVMKQTAYHNRPIVRVDEVRPIDKSLVHHPMAHAKGLWYSTMLDIGADPFHNDQRLTYIGLYGSDYNKLQLFVNDAEVYRGTVENADMDIFYWHLLNQFWAVKGGINYFNQPSLRPYWQPGIGIEGLMPYFIDTNIRFYYYGGSFKLDAELSRDTQITNNFFIRTGVRAIAATSTVVRAQIGNGLNQTRLTFRPYYRIQPGINVFVEYENEQDFGAFNTLQNNTQRPSIDNTISFGFVVLI